MNKRSCTHTKGHNIGSLFSNGFLKSVCMCTSVYIHIPLGSPGGSDGKESACHAGDPGSIPGSGSSPGKGNGYPLQYTCLENSMDSRAWWATVHGVTKSWTRLSD